MSSYPVIYIRGYAGNQAGVEETVDDPFYGFNRGSTHVRVGPEGGPQFFAFESPLLRLMTDHSYAEVFEGELQGILRLRADDDPARKQRTIWIHRYYDATSKTYDSETIQRLEIEQAAERLGALIAQIKKETNAEKTILVAHSMGGLICRSLLQKIYPERNQRAADHVDKVFTYGTPHGGVHLEIGGGALEWVRDQIGWNNSDDFGRRRMYQYLTPGAGAGDEPPPDFKANSLGGAFPEDRFFCLVGTNARDYDAAHGLSRRMVGPQSDGLVQIGSAYVAGAHRAFVHRSHSGRYGMVNSEEGYQNLQRFFFGDVKVDISLCDVEAPTGPDVSYQAEVRFTIRGLPVLLHERTTDHYCPILMSDSKRSFKLFTAFLIPRYAARQGDTCRYAMRVSVQALQRKDGWLTFNDHLEQIPLWSDDLVVDLTPGPDGYSGSYGWRSETQEPATPLDPQSAQATSGAEVALPSAARRVLGKNARILLEAQPWS